VRCLISLTPFPRASCNCLRDDVFVSRNLRGLLEHGIQKSMDKDEPKGPVDPSTLPLAIETMMDYTGSVGTALWYEIRRDHGKVRGQDPSYDSCTESCFP
jgi:hypothetical protein